MRCRAVNDSVDTSNDVVKAEATLDTCASPPHVASLRATSQMEAEVPGADPQHQVSDAFANLDAATDPLADAIGTEDDSAIVAVPSGSSATAIDSPATAAAAGSLRPLTLQPAVMIEGRLFWRVEVKFPHAFTQGAADAMAQSSSAERAARGFILALDAVEDTTTVESMLLPYVGTSMGSMSQPASSTARLHLAPYIAALAADATASVQHHDVTHLLGELPKVEAEPLHASSGADETEGAIAISATQSVVATPPPLHPLLLFLEHPVAVLGRTVYHRIKAASSSATTIGAVTLRDALRGRVIIEFPTLVVALPGTESDFPLLEPPPRAPQPIVLKAEVDGGHMESSAPSLLGPHPNALRRLDVPYAVGNQSSGGHSGAPNDRDDGRPRYSSWAGPRQWGEGPDSRGAAAAGGGASRSRGGRGGGSRGARGGARGRGSRGGRGAAQSHGRGGEAFRGGARGAPGFRPRM